MKKGSNEYLHEAEPKDELEKIDDIPEVEDLFPNMKPKIPDIDTALGKMETPAYAPTDLDAMATRVMQIPGEVKAYENKSAAITRKTDAINKRIEEIENSILGSVAAEKDAEGKTKYSNEAMRKGEATRRQKQDPEYNVLVDELTKQIQEGQNTKTQLNFLVGEGKAINQLIDIFKIKLRML